MHTPSPKEEPPGVRFAQSEPRDYDRTGPYVGIAGAFALENFDLDDYERHGRLGFDLDSTNSWAVNARVGYRLHPNWAAELNIEYYPEFEFEGSGGADLFRMDGFTLTVNGKYYPFVGRWQPYLLGGAGIMYSHVEAADNVPVPFDDKDTGFAARTAAGLDFYLWRDIVLNVEAGYVIPTGSVDDFQLASFVFGAQYRFTRPAAPLPVVAPIAVAPAAPPPSAPRRPPARRIVLRGVNFDFDKADIRPDAAPVLDAAIEVLTADPSIRVVVEGHTDSRGTEAYNAGLSLRRANAVQDYLVAGGVSVAQLEVAGMGEANPVASNDTDDGRAQNRRVELRVLPQ